MNPITIPNITIPVIGLPTIGIPSVGFPSASGGGLAWPAGMKEHIKAIYDPAKQGMTNYDVIESYATNFKVWSKTTGVTHVNEYTMSFIDVPIKGYVLRVDDFVPFSILVSGLTNGEIIATTYTNNNGEYITITITKNGVYSYPVDSTRIIFNCITAIQNATITQLPTSILKDLSGNGNHAYLYGGKGKLNSGMGLYKVDYTTYNNNGNQNVTDIKPNSFVLLAGALSRLGLPYSSIIGEYIPSYAIRIQGISGGTITYYYRNENGKQLTYVMDADGDYILPPCYSEGTEGTAVNIVSNNNINNVTITQIPDYPNQLCYDGKMYAVCYGFPILTDYTVMADRTWFDKEEYSAFVSNSLGGMEEPGNGAFSVEVKSLDSFTVMSFGSLTSISTPKKGITYQTKQSYNGISINVGTRESNDVLTLGGRYYYKNDNNAGNLWNGCHGKIIIADRSFTEDEITWLKDNWKKI